MDQKFFLQSFAFAGDKTAIPDALQPSGTVSFNQGFGFDYQRELGVDPAAKAMPRQEMNYLLGAITDNVGVWQRYTFPEWITSANNGGAAFPYPRGAIVRYRASGGDPFVIYQSRVDNNTAVPAAGANWAVLTFEVATTAQATAGTDDATIMTPLKVAQAIAGTSFTIPDASETVKGKVELATNAETTTGTDTTRATHPAGVAAAIAAAVPAATTAVAGKVRLATNAETTAGALATVAVTPAGAKVELDKKANLNGPTFTGTVRSQFNSPDYIFSSAGGVYSYQVLANVSDAVDGGLLFRRWNGAAWAEIGNINSNGFYVTGVVTATAGFGPTSSRHLKKFYEEEFPYGLETFEKFAYHVGEYLPSFNADGRRRLFMVAEDVAEHMPEAELKGLVEIDGVAYSGIDHSTFIPAMAKALADASREIRKLRERVAKLEG